MEEDLKAWQDILDVDTANMDADREKRRAYRKAFKEMMERREAERKAYGEMMMAKWEADPPPPKKKEKKKS
jgi:hypothetical protein